MVNITYYLGLSSIVNTWLIVSKKTELDGAYFSTAPHPTSLLGRTRYTEPVF